MLRVAFASTCVIVLMAAYATLSTRDAQMTLLSKAELSGTVGGGCHFVMVTLAGALAFSATSQEASGWKMLERTLSKRGVRISAAAAARATATRTIFPIPCVST